MLDGWYSSINVYKAVVLTALLCGAESYGSPIVTICISSSVTISAACNAILYIHWSDFVNNIWVLEMVKVTSIEAMLIKTQLCWAGQTIAYQRSYYNIYGELSTCHRDKGTPMKIYKVTLNRSLATCNIDYRQWTTQATIRMNWRRTIYQATTSSETTRIDRRSGPVDALDRHTGFESCAAVSHGHFFTQYCSN